MKGMTPVATFSKPTFHFNPSPAHARVRRRSLNTHRIRKSIVTATNDHESASSADVRVYRLHVKEVTPEIFQPFGQVIGPTDDGKEYDREDAQLVLDQGTPRFYIMRLPRRGMSFDRITYHAKVTQCLGSIGLQPWYLAVAAPSGSLEEWPRPDQVHAFRIPPGTFLKLHQGTWHAGPLFDIKDSMAFYNLELSDTNIADHATHEYKHDNLMFVLEE